MSKFQTDSVDLASYLSVVLDYPECSIDPPTRIVSFTFDNGPAAAKAAAEYHLTGGVCSARALLKVRGFLYREIGRLRGTAI